jgi:gluconokinase
MIVIVMGVSGSGKTTIGTLLASRTGATFADADDYHPLANKQKMAAGHPLTDEDRKPWLETLNKLIAGWQATGTQAVLACSALKQSHRATLSLGIPPDSLRWVFLDGSPQLIAARLAARHHEFMDPHLLTSQLQTLEPPVDALRVVNDRTPAAVVDEIVAKLGPQA